MKNASLSQYGMTSMGKEVASKIGQLHKVKKEVKRQRMNGVIEKVLNSAKK